ncbi:HAUS6 protein, partial [Psophia crepitans]|nr:HAUS6 protein [Psophia crepitans]
AYRMKQNDQTKNDKTDRIQKVRNMWALILEMLNSLKKEKEIVDSVFEDCDSQCVLDGTDVVLHVPEVLSCRVHSLQCCTGELYEAEKLNFLTVIELLNEALRTLQDVITQSEVKQQLQVIERRITLHNEILQDLQAKNLQVEQQHCVSVSQSVSTKQEAWEVKWKNFLEQCPFDLFLSQNPVSSV